jgi:hypothetical protein
LAKQSIKRGINMNLEQLDLTTHPVILDLTRRLVALEQALSTEHEKLVLLEQEHARDHRVIGKIEHQSYPPPRPLHVAVGL